MKTVGAFEAKTHLSRLLRQVENHREKIIIERRGKKIAMLIPFEEVENQHLKNRRSRILEGFQEIRSMQSREERTKSETLKDFIVDGRKR